VDLLIKSFANYFFSSVAKKEAFYSIKEDKDEQKEFETGPLSVLMQSVQQNTQVRPLEYQR
jgi:hypothetical protein